MRRIKGLALLLSLLLVFSIVGCTSKEKPNEELSLEDIDSQGSEVDEEIVSFPVEIEDSFGNKVTIEKEPTKIVSLAPNNTEVLFALGLGDKVIGVTSYCDYPEEAKTKEVVGDFSGNNLEKIVELNPDLVLIYGAGNEEDNKILKEAGIKVLGFMPETIDAVMKDIETVGKATGKDKEASEFIKSMNNKKNEILDKVKDQEKIKVFYEIWHDPLMTAGKGSYIDELITLSGGENIAQDADGAYPQYDLEQLVERNPEVYLTSADTEDKTVESIKSRPGYENISAIENDRIHIFEGNESNIMSRPGPRIIEALELVAKSIHPELFK
ncbi:cobalamin-binding protein [Tissierella pigra]|uniref:Cobalamin-binding protein n=1 Tax=Tissierella pigra TaxID=2607614 RepID=A0A6N7XL28_9FIRM|nr:cobalamin-binding protein [Tissierella pigra]MBU5425886.1 cobalamin-binding protein [Tissierella pigra]MSU02276.1 cobalamin-binding protein [Tissierella pigra]